jgi:hypothetical protein
MNPIFPGVSCFLGDPIVDIGCSWGRWTIAGAQAGHRVIGIDTRLRALHVALSASPCRQRLGELRQGVISSMMVFPFSASGRPNPLTHCPLIAIPATHPPGQVTVTNLRKRGEQATTRAWVLLIEEHKASLMRHLSVLP